MKSVPLWFMNKRRKQDAIENPPLSGPSGHEVGTAGEQFIEELWKLPFGRDFLFANPKYKKGQNEREVCDLLLLLDNYVVVVQIKTAEPASKSEWDEQRWADWHNKKIDESLKQLRGGLRAMLDGRVLSVENDRQGRVAIDPNKLTHLFGIVIVDGPTLDHWGAHPVVEVAGRSVPVLLTSHQHMIEFVTELSTPMDLIDYLGAHARFFEHNALLGASDLDLLAFYKSDPRKFLAALDEHTTIIVESGLWKTFAQQDARAKRAELDRPSYILDDMLEYVHQFQFAKLDHMDALNSAAGNPAPTKEQKRMPANALAKIRRMDRRQIGRMLEQKSALCLQESRSRYFGRFLEDQADTMFVFLVTNDERKIRVEKLTELCQAAILKFGRPRVFGYAREPVEPGRGHSLDAIAIRQHPRSLWEELSEEEREHRLRLFPSITSGHETEFGGPQAPPTTTPLDPGDWPATFP